MITVSKKVVIKCKPVEQALYPGADNYKGRKPLGSTFDKFGNIYNPLTDKESKELLSKVIGVTPTDTNWIEKNLDYWKNISIPIDYEEGLTLEVGKYYPTEEDKKKDQNFQYINSNHIIIYKFALGHHRVVNTFNDIYVSPKIEFYIQDKEADIKAKQKLVDIADDAMTKYLELKSKESEVENILLGLDVIITGLTKSEKQIKLKEFVTKKPQLFIDFVNKPDRDLMINLRKYIGVGLIKNTPNTGIYEFNETLMGVNFDELILFAKSQNASNVKIMNDLDALYKAKLK